MEPMRIYVVDTWTKVAVGRLQRNEQSGETFRK